MDSRYSPVGEFWNDISLILPQCQYESKHKVLKGGTKITKENKKMSSLPPQRILRVEKDLYCCRLIYCMQLHRSFQDDLK